MHESTGIPVEAILIAAGRDDVRSAIASLYAELEADIAARGPTCWNKGDCCRFGEYGHRLYVTTLEVAYYLALGSSSSEQPVVSPAAPAGLPILQQSSAVQQDACPHAHGGRCHVRDRRPLGCRIFYCDPAAQVWQGPVTEHYLARLRTLHEELAVPYIYADWMSILRALDEAAGRPR